MLSQVLSQIQRATKNEKSEKMDELYEELSSAVMDLRSISPDHMALLLMTAITNGGNNESDGKNDGPEETETVYCWGSNSSQQLTDSVAEDKESFIFSNENLKDSS